MKYACVQSTVRVYSPHKEHSPTTRYCQNRHIAGHTLVTDCGDAVVQSLYNLLSLQKRVVLQHPAARKVISTLHSHCRAAQLMEHNLHTQSTHM